MAVSHSLKNPGRRSLHTSVFRHLFAPIALGAGTLAVSAASIASWFVWSLVPGAQAGTVELHARFGIAAAILTTIFAILRNEHRPSFFLGDEHKAVHTANLWNVSFVVLLLMAFITRRADDLSRGVVVLFYVSGFLSLWATRRLTARLLRIASKLKVVVAQRLLVVGTEPAIGTFLQRHQPWNLGYEIVGTISVDPVPPGSPAAPSPEFVHAIEHMRALDIDDVYVAVPWSDTDTIDLCVEAFLNTPTAVHLAPERVLDRFDRVSISRVGAMSSLELTRPMSALSIAVKRAFDITASLFALVCLAPLMALVSLAIRFEGPGPIFFFQTRYGFNHRPFRIVKFRSMSTFDDGQEVRQATRNDPRITRVGAFLRASNLDELPQLLNVVRGEMSLVGPRPHAVPHNRAYERRIARYARRHNVRPGITGWAQVNGFRGETDTDEKMRRRVDHDLYYIDNWSMLFDLRIIARTIFSSAAYRNAR